MWTVSVTHSRISNLVPKKRLSVYPFSKFFFWKVLRTALDTSFWKYVSTTIGRTLRTTCREAYIYLRISSRGEKEMFMFVCCIFGGRWKNIFWKLFDRKLGDIEKVHEVAFSSMWKYIFYCESINALFLKISWL